MSTSAGLQQLSQRCVTSAQAQVLHGLYWWIEARGFCPTQRELADKLGYASKSSVQRPLNALREKGMVEWIEHAPRTLRPTAKGMEWLERAKT